ncbi:aldo/keto reductase [Streptococcus troglodytae]|uniref:Methylglyoxal reductase (NADPH-dependent) n=1 Tax=Streptococcus troglodytae TaxID=1111760 RepID=A0A1L7LKA4_9STRE|nr:aldo/keto reductase [Streptococcus troglodytae]BAQ24462.1 methylglyoxal reductase (NADPH-dependent) [Streptococcus troglodytae]
MQTITLNNGIQIPQLGFGVFQVPDLKQAEDVISIALKAGYRHIDTAAAYMNEEAVGGAVRKSGLPREEVFITSKLWVQDFGYEKAKKAIQTSLDKLNLDYIDLYLLHQPVGDYIGAWRALEEAYKAGKIKAIGVSNFYPERLADFCETVAIQPTVNQVETHPFFQREDLLAVAKEYDVAIEAWGPFAEGKFGIFSHPVLTKIGEKYGKTAAQVALRWNLDRGVIVLPKSVTPERIEANIDVFDFSLDEKDKQEIAALDMGHSEIVNHYDPAFIKMLHSFKIHD